MPPPPNLKILTTHSTSSNRGTIAYKNYLISSQSLPDLEKVKKKNALKKKAKNAKKGLHRGKSSFKKYQVKTANDLFIKVGPNKNGKKKAVTVRVKTGKSRKGGKKKPPRSPGGFFIQRHIPEKKKKRKKSNKVSCLAFLKKLFRFRRKKKNRVVDDSHSQLSARRQSTVHRNVKLIRSLSFNTNSLSDVSLARTPSIDGLVAYKSYGDNLSNIGHDRVRMEEEIHSEMDHENIVKLHGRGEDFHKSPSLLMEFIDGEDLQTYVKQHHPIPMPKIQAIMTEIISAVEHVHSKGYVHGDLKTSNILLQKPNDTVKISDFGASIKLDPGQTFKIIGSDALNGTPLFSAPEQIFADKNGDYKIAFASDIYQIALIFYEIMTGKMPQDDVAGDSFNVFGVIMKLRKKYDNGKMLSIPLHVLPDPDAQSFFESMIHVNYEKRATIKQLKALRWLTKKL